MFREIIKYSVKSLNVLFQTVVVATCNLRHTTILKHTKILRSTKLKKRYWILSFVKRYAVWRYLRKTFGKIVTMSSVKAQGKLGKVKHKQPGLDVTHVACDWVSGGQRRFTKHRRGKQPVTLVTSVRVGNRLTRKNRDKTIRL